jgi:hypothetical protein
MEKLVPYSLYLPEAHIKKLKSMAKNRKASSFIRDALIMALDKTDEYSSGYNKGIKDACSIIKDNPEASFIAVRGRSLNDILVKQIEILRHEPKCQK